MPKVVFGPWFGEFGWEITRWNPACRFLADRKYAEWDKIVIAPMGHKIMYDFADQYIDIEAFDRTPNMHTAQDLEGVKKYIKMANEVGDVRIASELVAPQRKFQKKAVRLQGNLHGKIGNLAQNKKIIVVFPRQRKMNAHRNWGVDRWIKLVKHYIKNGYAVFAFGGLIDNPLPVDHPSYFDFIGYREDDQLNYCISALNLAECGIAIQSGGIHLSMYACKATAAFGLKSQHKRHLALAGKEYPKSRYKYFGFPSKKWKDIPLKFVIENTEALLNER